MSSERFGFSTGLETVFATILTESIWVGRFTGRAMFFQSVRDSAFQKPTS